MKKILVWDLPTRLFHWALVCLVMVSLYTGLMGGFKEMDFHMMSGYGILGLILFRICWGILGSRYARFSAFIKGPVVTFRYTQSLLDRNTKPSPGHNPLGALSIVAMIIVFSIQAMTGLFANDDIMVEGPLTHLVSYDTSRSLTRIHKLNYYFIVGLVALHLGAILFYWLYKKQNLTAAMISGRQCGSNDAVAAETSWWLFAFLSIVVVLGVYLIVNKL